MKSVSTSFPYNRADDFCGCVMFGRIDSYGVWHHNPKLRMTCSEQRAANILNRFMKHETPYVPYHHSTHRMKDENGLCIHGEDMKCDECGHDLVDQLGRWQAIKLAWAVLFKPSDPYAKYRGSWLEKRLEQLDVSMQKELRLLRNRCSEDETGDRIYLWKTRDIERKYKAKKDKLKQESAQRSLINKRWEL